MVSSNMPLFFIGIIIIFIMSGLTLIPSLWMSLSVVFFSAVFLLFRYFQKKQVPSNIYFFVSLLISFFFLTVSSFLLSINISVSLEKLLLFVSCFMLFLVSSQFKVETRFVLLPIFITVGIYTLLYLFKLFNWIPLPFLTTGGYQMILPTTDSHNHLGDLIGLIIAVTPFMFKSKYAQKTLLYLFLPILIMSFSKSAFLSLGVTSLAAFFIEVDRERKQRMLFHMFRSLYIIIPVIMIYSSEFSHNRFIEPIQKYFSYAFQIVPKPLLSTRDIYFSQVTTFVTRMIPEHIGLGIGLGNFSYLSSSVVADISYKIGSAHNFFLNMFVEGGLLSVLWMLVFFTLVVFGGLKKKMVVVLPVIYILVNFQTDYTYQIPLMLFLLFFYAGQVHARYSTSFLSPRVILLFLVIGSVGYAMIFTQLNIRQNKLLNLTTYLSSVGKTESRQKLYPALIALEKERPYEEITLLRIAEFYNLTKNHSEERRVLEKLSLYSPHMYVKQFPKLLLAIEQGGGDSNEYLRKQRLFLLTLPLSQEERDGINVICKNNLKSICL